MLPTRMLSSLWQSKSAGKAKSDAAPVTAREQLPFAKVKDWRSVTIVNSPFQAFELDLT